MTDVDGATAAALVEFLHEAGPGYVLKLPCRIGALPYFRPSEHGGFQMRAVLGGGEHIEEEYLEDAEVAETILKSQAVEVVPAERTPPEVFGELPGQPNAYAAEAMLEARTALRRAAELVEGERAAETFEALADLARAEAKAYIEAGADGDAEVAGDGD